MKHLLLAAAFTVVFATNSLAIGEEEHVSHFENVLGTSLEFRIENRSDVFVKDVEQTALNEIDRLAKILSRHDNKSELMRWQRGELTSKELSTDLLAVLQRSEQWRTTTDGAFDVRIGALTKLWSDAEKIQSVPTEEKRKEITTKLNDSPWLISSKRFVKKQDALPVSLDGLAKGYILDCVCGLLVQKYPEMKSFTINIGGDIRSIGNKSLLVNVTDPSAPAENSAPLFRLTLKGSQAVATSGSYRRFYTIKDQRFSHLIDPRNGLPVDHVLSVTVTAPKAVDADALATALSVMQPTEALKLINSLPEIECAILNAAGKLLLTSGFPAITPRTQLANFENKDNNSNESTTGLHVNFSLNRPRRGRYRRPYVAIWLEDSDGFPVKTALLWMQTEQPGPRWHRDLTRWYRNDRVRKVAEKKDLIGTISGATRGPGDYEAHFDGTDNLGHPLPFGNYTLCFEVAREHGTYQLIRKRLKLGDKPISVESLKGNVEMGGVKYSYTPWPEKEETSSGNGNAE